VVAVSLDDHKNYILMSGSHFGANCGTACWRQRHR